MAQVRLGERVEFGDRRSFPRGFLTAFRSSGAKKLYRVDALAVAAKFPDLKFREMRAKCAELGVDPKAMVSIVDLKPLLAYLRGEAQVVPQLDYNAQELVAQGDGQEARADGEAGGQQKLTAEDVRAASLDLVDRNTMLLCPGKEFQKVLTILDGADAARRKKREREAAREVAAAPKQPKPNLVARSNRFGDVKKDDYYKGGLKTSIDIQAFEFGGARDAQPSEPAEALPPRPKPAAPPAQAGGSRKGKGREGNPNDRIPIILVPPGFDTLLNIHNARAFLMDGAYKSWEECQAEGKGRTDAFYFKREIGPAHRRHKKFLVQDRIPSSPKHRDWQRVVAVFSNGKKWQFKKYPDHDNLVKTFSNMRAYHLRFGTEDVPDFVKQWNVRVLTLDKNKRYQDRNVAMDFWADLDKFLSAKNPEHLDV